MKNWKEEIKPTIAYANKVMYTLNSTAMSEALAYEIHYLACKLEILHREATKEAELLITSNNQKKKQEAIKQATTTLDTLKELRKLEQNILVIRDSTYEDYALRKHYKSKTTVSNNENKLHAHKIGDVNGEANEEYRTIILEKIAYVVMLSVVFFVEIGRAHV